MPNWELTAEVGSEKINEGMRLRVPCWTSVGLGQSKLVDSVATIDTIDFGQVAIAEGCYWH